MYDSEQINGGPSLGGIAIDLAQLAAGMPGLTSSKGMSLAEAASVCLEHCDHDLETDLSITGYFDEMSSLQRLPVTQQMRNANHDLQEATEDGACGVAILGVHRLTGAVVVDRSVKGNGFDYWLGESDDEDAPPFIGVKRLEISGILKGNAQHIDSRQKLKIKQVQPTSAIGPAFISIVEFSGPELRIHRT